MPEYQNNDQVCQATTSLQENLDFGKDLELSKISSDACSQRPGSNILMRIITIFLGILESIFGVCFIYDSIGEIIKNGINKISIFYLVFSIGITISGITYLLTGILRTFFCKKGYLKSIGLILGAVSNIFFIIKVLIIDGKKDSILCIFGLLAVFNILVYLGVSFQDKVPFLRFFAPFKWVKTPQ